MPIQKAGERKPRTFEKSSMLIFGRNRVGKSTIASQIPNACVIATEPGLNLLSVDNWSDDKGNYVVKNWTQLEGAITEVGQSGNYDTIIIDTIDNAVHLCYEHVCKEYGVDYHNSEKLAWGKGVHLINNKLRYHVKDLAMKSVGICFLSHSKDIIEKKQTGDVQRFVPNLPDEIRFVLLGCIDYIFYMTKELDEAGKKTSVCIKTKASSTHDGGCRLNLKETIWLPDERKMWETLSKECNEAIKKRSLQFKK